MASTLLIGSMAVADAYSTRLQAIASSGITVRGEMADRIIDGAAVLPSEAYAHILLVLAPEERLRLLQALVTPLLHTVADQGVFEVEGIQASDDGAARNALAPHFARIESTATSMLARKPVRAPASQTASGTSVVPLRLKSRGSSAAKKASLWSLTRQSDDLGTPTVDESSLLTAEDLKRREAIQRPDCDVKRTRKACKNCSCGLRELLLQEQDDLPGAAKVAMPLQAGDGVQVVGTGVTTSSCGSCYLGDAFRCSSCPFLGLPAFEPGEKVKLPNGFADDV